jgi:hypothetical protein
MNAMLEASMVVARIQGAVLFAHTRAARAAESVTGLHGSDDTVDIYLPAALGWAFGVEAMNHLMIIQSATPILRLVAVLTP